MNSKLTFNSLFPVYVFCDLALWVPLVSDEYK